LELSDGSFASEIFQLGAKCEEANFSVNILPEGSIDWGVTKFATNISVKKNPATGNRSLFDVKVKEYLPSKTAKDALAEFLNWLKNLKIKGDYSDIVLVAHGDTDMPALINNISRADLMQEMIEIVDTFADSLKYFQTNFKSWIKYGLSTIYPRVFPDRPKFKAHSATEDATALYDVLIELNKDNKTELYTRIKELSESTQTCISVAKKRIIKTLSKPRKNKNNINPNVRKFLSIT